MSQREFSRHFRSSHSIERLEDRLLLSGSLLSLQTTPLSPTTLDDITVIVKGSFPHSGYSLVGAPVLKTDGRVISIDLQSHYFAGFFYSMALVDFQSTIDLGHLSVGSYVDHVRLFVDGQLNGTLDGSFQVGAGVVPTPSPAVLAAMEAKALDYEANIEARHLVNGQIVSRKADGSPDEEGDAATYTSYYVVSQVFKYKATGNPAAYQNVEDGLNTIHKMFLASGMSGIPARYVYPDGRAFFPHDAKTPNVPDPTKSFASKDVITAILYAFNNAVPILHDGPVKDAALADVRAMAENFIANDFAFAGSNPNLGEGGVTEFESFNPGMTLSELTDMARINPEMLPRMVDTLGRLKSFGNLRWRGIPYVQIALGFLGVYYRQIANHWDDWNYFRDRHGSRSDYDWMRANMTSSDFRSLARFFWNTEDFSQKSGLYELVSAFFHGGAALEDTDWRQMRSFLDDLITAPRESDAILAVLAQHWNAGFNTYLNILVRTIKEMPDAVPSFLTSLAHSLGTQPENLAGQLSPGGSSLSALAVSYNATGGSLPGDINKMRAFVDDATAEKIFAMAGVPSEEQASALNTLATSASSSDDTNDRILEGVEQMWSIMSDLLVPGTSAGVIGALAVNDPGDASQSEIQAVVGDPLPILLLKLWFANDRANRAVLKQYTSAIPSSFASPDQLKIIPGRALLQFHVLSVAARLTGVPAYERTYLRQRAALLESSVLWSSAEDDIVRHILGDDVNNALNVGGTHNVPWVAIADLLDNETDPATLGLYQQMAAKMIAPIGADLNAYASLITYGHGGEVARDAFVTSKGLDSLINFPPYGPTDFSYTNKIEIVNQMFGGLGPVVPGVQQGTLNAIPTDMRPRDSFTWQRSPRRLTNGSPEGKVFAGVDFLLPYWMASAQGLFPVVDTRPIMGVDPSPVVYTEKDRAVTVAGGLTLSDAEGNNLAGATVSISGGFIRGQDFLGFTDQNGITGSYNAATGELILTGSATSTNYQDALRSIDYFNRSGKPNTNSRIITFVVNDGMMASVPVSRTINVIALNDARLSGVVFFDTNANGRQDVGEKGAAKVKVFLDTNRNGLLDRDDSRVLTDAVGQYHFDHLLAKTYDVRIVLPRHRVISTPRKKLFSIKLIRGNKVTGANFGLRPN